MEVEEVKVVEIGGEIGEEIGEEIGKEIGEEIGEEIRRGGIGKKRKREIGNKKGICDLYLFLYFLKFLFQEYIPNYLLYLYWNLGLYISY